jgi:hypothetical protein
LFQSLHFKAIRVANGRLIQRDRLPCIYCHTASSKRIDGSQKNTNPVFQFRLDRNHPNSLPAVFRREYLSPIELPLRGLYDVNNDFCH